MGLLSEIFKNKTVDNHYLISLDIGTEIAKALVFYIDPEKKKVVIVGVGEEFHKSGNVHGSVILSEDGIISTCGKAINKAKKMAGISLKSKKQIRVIIGVSGELAKVKTEIFSYKRKNQKSKIGQSELRDITRKAKQKIFKSVEREIARKNGNDKKRKVEFIGIDISEIKINGYKVTDILDFKGDRIEMAVYGIYMFASNFNIIKNVSDSLNLSLLNIIYNPYAVVKSVVIQNRTGSNAIFIDIGGSITDIALEKNRNIEDVKTFVLGGRMFIEKTPNDDSSESDENEKNKNIESNLGNIRKTEEKEKDCFNCNLWISGIELSLKEFSKSRLLPADIFVYGGGSQIPEIAGSLNELLSMKNLPFDSKPKIKFICPKDITNVIDQTGKLVGPRDITPMSIAASAVN